MIWWVHNSRGAPFLDRNHGFTILSWWTTPLVPFGPCQPTGSSNPSNWFSQLDLSWNTSWTVFPRQQLFKTNKWPWNLLICVTTMVHALYMDGVNLSCALTDIPQLPSLVSIERFQDDDRASSVILSEQFHKRISYFVVNLASYV